MAHRQNAASVISLGPLPQGARLVQDGAPANQAVHQAMIDLVAVVLVVVHVTNADVMK
jgi:hypothetical protein